MNLLADYNMPFAAALVFMVLLAVVQAVGLDLGGDADAEIDFDADIDAEGANSASLGGGMASLLGLGRVPLTAWLAVFLFAFAAIGVSGQSLAQNLLGGPFDRWAAAALAALGAFPVTGALVRPLGRILPQDETTAVSPDALVGRRAVVTTGTGRTGSPARSKVYDHHGQAHYVMMEPHELNAEVVEGEQVLLVRREGDVFFGKKLEERRLSPN